MILFATLCVSAGETLLSAGMKMAGKEGQTGVRIALAAIANWRVLFGSFLMMVFFVLYALCLSWADISFVIPFTALSYLFVAIFAQFLLHEDVTLTRWLGTLLIVLGVVVVGLGERH